MPEFKKFLCLVIFLFNRSKNNAVLEPRKGNFRGLVGWRNGLLISLVMAKAKDLSFEANAKDFKMCPRGQGRPQGLHLC